MAHAAARIQEATPEWHLRRGNSLLSSGDTAAAIARYNLALDPLLAPAYLNRGRTRLDLGDWEGAVADLSRAIKLHPRYARAHALRGIALLMQGKEKTAEADFKQSLSLSRSLKPYPDAQIKRLKQSRIQ